MLGFGFAVDMVIGFVLTLAFVAIALTLFDEWNEKRKYKVLERRFIPKTNVVKVKKLRQNKRA